MQTGTKGRCISLTSGNNSRKAVLTIEAAAVLPFFACFLVFVLYFFRILQVHAGVAQALQYTGRRMAAECSLSGQAADKETKPDGKEPVGEEMEPVGKETEPVGSRQTGIAERLKAELFFTKQLKKQNCPLQYITHGISGISLLQSDFSGNYIELRAVYRMQFPLRLPRKLEYRIVQVQKCRKWTGLQPGQDTQGDDTWLYYTEYGTVYHASRSCTHLDLSIRGVSYAQAGSLRNSSGGKYHKCEKCGSSASGHGMVYITSYGDRYHGSLTCSGLKRSIYMIRRSQASDKRMCSKCGG